MTRRVKTINMTETSLRTLPSKRSLNLDMFPGNLGVFFVVHATVLIFPDVPRSALRQFLPFRRIPCPVVDHERASRVANSNWSSVPAMYLAAGCNTKQYFVTILEMWPIFIPAWVALRTSGLLATRRSALRNVKSKRFRYIAVFVARGRI